MFNLGFITQEPLEKDGRFFGQSSRVMPIIYNAFKENSNVQMHNLSMNDRSAMAKLMLKFMKAYGTSAEKKALGPNMMARAFAEFDIIERFLRGPVCDLPKLDALVLDLRSVGAPYDFWEWCLVYYYLYCEPVKKIYIFDCDDLFPSRLTCVKQMREDILKRSVVMKGTARGELGYEYLSHRWFIPEMAKIDHPRFLPSTDLSYAGYDYGRRAMFDKYLTDIDLGVNIMGKYPEEYIAKHSALTFTGVTDWHKVIDTYNDSVGVLQLIRKRYIPIGMVPTRLWETAGAHTLSFLPSEYPDKEQWGLPECFVSSRAELEEKVHFYKSHPFERRELIEKNYALFAKDKPADICNIIINHFNAL